jgi:hypothetical protein
MPPLRETGRLRPARCAVEEAGRTAAAVGRNRGSLTRATRAPERHGLPGARVRPVNSPDGSCQAALE